MAIPSSSSPCSHASSYTKDSLSSWITMASMAPEEANALTPQSTRPGVSMHTQTQSNIIRMWYPISKNGVFRSQPAHTLGNHIPPPAGGRARRAGSLYLPANRARESGDGGRIAGSAIPFIVCARGYCRFLMRGSPGALARPGGPSRPQARVYPLTLFWWDISPGYPSRRAFAPRSFRGSGHPSTRGLAFTR